MNFSDGIVMKKKVDALTIIQESLGTFEHRQPFYPGMFEPLTPLFHDLGYDSVAVYMVEDYPDRMNRIAGYGGEGYFPELVVLNQRKSLHEELGALVQDVPNVMTERLFNHDRELGAIAVTCKNTKAAETGQAFKLLARSLSVMSYLERIRKNDRRERVERDIFFAQSLTSRMLVRTPPKVKHMRLGFEFIRSLDACGDFFDFVPKRDGSLLGLVGCCSGQGLKTVMEVVSILKFMHVSLHGMESLGDVLRGVNHLLVKERRRAHQASLALFHIDVKQGKLRIAKAGRLGMLLCGPRRQINNITASGSTFLGMVDKPNIYEEEYDFRPGQALFCVTEGFYNAKNIMGVPPSPHWFLRSVEEVLGYKKRQVPLANAIFDCVNRENDHTVRPENSLLALSVEFMSGPKRTAKDT